MNILKGPLNDEPASEVGWYSVVMSRSGEFRIAGGERLGFWEWLFGRRRFYQVYTATHRLEFRYDLQSGQSTYKFNAHVTATAQLRDALSAAQHGVRNTAETLRQPIEEALQEAVRSIDFRQTATAWSQGLAALRQLNHPLIKLTEIVLKIEPDADARDHLRTIEGQGLRTDAWEADSETTKLEREDMLESLGDFDKMLARLMTERDPQKRTMLKDAIALKTQRYDKLTQLQIEAFKIALESGHFEDFEVPKGLMNLLEKMDKSYGVGLPPTQLLGGEAPGAGDDPPKADGDKADSQ